MNPIVTTDPTITPDEALVFSYIGDKSILWNTLKEYLYTHHSDITEIWRYYNDGKCWLFRYQKKAKTICWLSILQNTFQIGFWFGEKAEPLILASDLSESVKENYRNAKRTKIGRGIGFVIHNSMDIENAIQLMELRIKIK